MSRLTDRLRAMHSDLRQGAMFTPAEDPTWDCTAAAADLIDAIDALHGPYERAADAHWCRQCLLPWPCPTHRILHPEETE